MALTGVTGYSPLGPSYPSRVPCPPATRNAATFPCRSRSCPTPSACWYNSRRSASGRRGYALTGWMSFGSATCGLFRTSDSASFATFGRSRAANCPVSFALPAGSSPSKNRITPVWPIDWSVAARSVSGMGRFPVRGWRSGRRSAGRPRRINPTPPLSSGASRHARVPKPGTRSETPSPLDGARLVTGSPPQVRGRGAKRASPVVVSQRRRVSAVSPPHRSMRETNVRIRKTRNDRTRTSAVPISPRRSGFTLWSRSIERVRPDRVAIVPAGRPRRRGATPFSSGFGRPEPPDATPTRAKRPARPGGCSRRVCGSALVPRPRRPSSRCRPGRQIAPAFFAPYAISVSTAAICGSLAIAGRATCRPGGSTRACPCRTGPGSTPCRPSARR